MAKQKKDKTPETEAPKEERGPGIITVEGPAKPKRNYMAMLSKLSGAVNEYVNPHNNVIRISRSPSINFTFGKGHGLPRGYSLMMYGPYKGGKSLVSYDTIGALHEDSPTAVAVRWDTEMREQLQMTDADFKKFGIDSNRYKCFSINTPEGVYDQFEQQIAAMCDDGLDLRLAIIDSLSFIQGRQEQKAESVGKFQVGDQAQTNQAGLRRILPIIRKYNIALILTTQIRAEMDPKLVQRGQTIKPNAANATKHFAEYFAYVERNETKAGRTDERGNEMVNPNLLDIRGSEGDGELTGHKIRWIMKANSAGAPSGRQGEFIFDYSKGIVNIGQEVFLLGRARNIIEFEGKTYSFRDRKWVGKEKIFDELESNKDLQQEIIKELRRRDFEGEFSDNETVDASVPDFDDELLEGGMTAPA